MSGEGTIEINVGKRVICAPVAASDLEHAAKLIGIAADLCGRSDRVFLKGFCVALQGACNREAESLRKSFADVSGPVTHDS